jgi:WXXGXW repeat (2 copies)
VNTTKATTVVPERQQHALYLPEYPIMFKSWRSLLPIILALALPALGMAQITVSVNVAPPELPVYDQPPIPGDGYIWTPGYWAWSDDIQDYYWVPGTWVEAPEPDYLWTPGYWGVAGGLFLWHAGYWGPHVGFYGGVNYGYGYVGNGYEGGYWQGGRLYYNRSVNNINNVRITNVYNKTVINNVTVNRVSYNGGNGGIRAQPTPEQMTAAHERHIDETPTQRQHIEAAHGNPSLRVSENQGHPPIAATARPGSFTGPGVVGAQQAGGGRQPQAPASRPGTLSVVHPQGENTPQQRNDAEQQRQQAAARATEQQRQSQQEAAQRATREPPQQLQQRGQVEQRQQPPEQYRAAPPQQPHPSAPPPPPPHPSAPPPRPSPPPPPRPSAPPPHPSAPPQQAHPAEHAPEH